MHLAELYALTAGAKIGQPRIEPSYFPLGCEKHVTIQAGSGMKSKNYDYFNDVIRTILPELKKSNIKLVQIGLEKEKKLINCIDLRGQTSIRQASFLIKTALLHIGNDSFGCHIAGAFNTPLVGLYGVTPKECSGPFWGDKSKQAILQPDFKKNKPSYCSTEKTKRVNKIFPDEVASNILKLLGLNPGGADTEAVHLGKSYNRVIVDVVPDFEIPPNFQVSRSSPINLRLDYLKNKNPTGNWLKEFNCVVHTNSKEDIELIENSRQNIEKIYVYLSDDHTEEDLNRLENIAVKKIISYNNKENISDIRVKFFEHNIHLEKEGLKKDLDFPDKICNNSCYKSSLMLFSKNKIYPCKAALDLKIEKKDEQQVINTPDFYKEMEFYKIYNHG